MSEFKDLISLMQQQMELQRKQMEHQQKQMEQQQMQMEKQQNEHKAEIDAVLQQQEAHVRLSWRHFSHLLQRNLLKVCLHLRLLLLTPLLNFGRITGPDSVQLLLPTPSLMNERHRYF